MAMIGDWEAAGTTAAAAAASTTSSSSNSLLSSRESGGGQGSSSSSNNRLKMNFVDVASSSDFEDGSGGGGGCDGGGGSSEEESNQRDAIIDDHVTSNAGSCHKLSKIPLPPPMPVPPSPASFQRPPVAQSISDVVVSLSNSRKRDLNWCKSWPPPPAVKMSKEQAEARHLVLNEIKELQLRRQTSFKRILKLPIWGSGKINNVYLSELSSAAPPRAQETSVPTRQ